MSKRFTAKKIATLAMFSAISIILTRFLYIPLNNTLRISLGNIPVLISGIAFGPVAGALCGSVSDIIGCIFFNPNGWYPPLTLAPTIYGIIAGLLSKYARKSSFLNSFLTALICNACSTMTVSTVVLAHMQGIDFLPLLAIRVPLYVGIAVCEAATLQLFKKSQISKKVGL